MIVSLGAAGVAGSCPAGGDYNAWCDCMWPSPEDAATNAKCKAEGSLVSAVAPWTLVGSAARGIPFYGNILQSNLPDVPQPSSEGEGIFGIPTTVMFVGLGVLAAGGAALLVAKKSQKKSVAGYRRRKH